MQVIGTKPTLNSNCFTNNLRELIQKTDAKMSDYNSSFELNKFTKSKLHLNTFGGCSFTGAQLAER